MDLSIICVNWNSLDYLRECIPSVYQHTRGISFEIIVVDNASPTGDVDSLQREFPEVKLVKSAANLGFAGANNLGVRQSSGEYLLFLNPDTKLLSPAINLLLERARPLTNAGIVGCKLLNTDLSIQTSCIMNFPTLSAVLLRLEYFRLRWPRLWGLGPLFSKSTEPAAVEAISGACMLVRRKVFDAVGMFSEDYFMYSEDLDLCYQTRRAGLKNYYIGAAEIVHYAGTSSPSEWQTGMKQKAELRFCEKNYGRTYGWLFRMVSLANAAARLAILAVLSLRDKDNAWESVAAKWKTILRTLWTHSPGDMPSSPSQKSIAISSKDLAEPQARQGAH